ncbi:MAG: hypothetical protein CVT94_02830 [Bacteroidetes bacterium HGW-Bacteroidetes-11]|jgi:hypothetical protein|nr:MAG: hypothetical protein CVT94_02830 [Bacteroidetes bacterium HGW-Bacteroidetes-11]
MLKQKENRINSLGSAVFVFLIFLVLSAFAENQDRNHDAGRDLKNTTELYAIPAVIVDVQQFNFLQSLNRTSDYFKCKLSEELPKLISDNNIILHNIIFRERAGLLIRPVILQRFYNLYHICDNGDLPHLS